MKKVLLYVSFVTALVSCNNDKTAPRWEEKHNTREFGAVISMETYPVVVDEFMNIIPRKQLVSTQPSKNHFYGRVNEG